jgi:DNA-binding PadR family transcriptional regulator
MSLIPIGNGKRRGVYATEKQIAILKALVKRNADGTNLDVNELIERCAPGTTRGAMICSLRHLAMHGLVEEGDLMTRRGRRVRTYQATKSGADLVRPGSLVTLTKRKR